MKANEARQISKRVSDRQRRREAEEAARKKAENQAQQKKQRENFQKEIPRYIKSILKDVEEAALEGNFSIVICWTHRDVSKTSMNQANQVCAKLSALGYSAQAYEIERSRTWGHTETGTYEETYYDIDIRIEW